MSDKEKREKRQFKRPNIASKIPSGSSMGNFDPVGGILLVYMIFILIFWLGQSTSLNPINGDTGIQNQYLLAYNNTKWFLALFAPLGGYLVFNTTRKKMDEEEGYEDEI